MLSRDRSEEAHERLWHAVLKQAIKDARWDVTARTWFCSNNQETGSFLWICTLLDLIPESIRRLIARKYNDEAILARWSEVTVRVK